MLKSAIFTCSGMARCWNTEWGIKDARSEEINIQSEQISCATCYIFQRLINIDKTLLNGMLCYICRHKINKREMYKV